MKLSIKLCNGTLTDTTGDTTNEATTLSGINYYLAAWTAIIKRSVCVQYKFLRGLQSPLGVFKCNV